MNVRTTRLTTISAVACMVSLPGALFAQGKPAEHSLHLKPNAEWKLSAMDDRCRMSRTFGSGEDRTTLWIDKGGPGPAVNLTFIGAPLRSPFGPYLEVGFLPGKMIERNYIVSTSSKGRPVIALFGVEPVPLRPPPDPVSLEDSIAEEETVDLSEGALSLPIDAVTHAQQLAEIDTLHLSRALREPLSLGLEDFAPTMAELMRCTEELTERLANNTRQSKDADTGVAPKEQAQWARKIQANYPYQLLREGQEATVGVRLTVNAKGRASFCEVTAFSGPASFNDTACLQLLRHARFAPATNAAGEAVPAFFTTRIIYAIKR